MFIAIGLVGAVLLLSSLLLDDWLDELVPDVVFLSGPVIGTFLVGVGLFGWYGENGPGLATGPAVLLGLGAGAVLGYGTYRGVKFLNTRETDATPTTASLVGKPARVVTPLRDGLSGEVLVLLGGTNTKYTAVSDEDLEVGSSAVVIAVESPTKVRVESEARFWA